jgi:UDP-N-acetylglucosamine:LPS N-acetylglucosamine transferase
MKGEIKSIEYLVILSGPEPQRTIFEDIIIKQANDIQGNIVILRAKPEENKIPSNAPKNIIFFNHVDDETFVKIVARAKNIICRGGYSSLMDLITLNRNAYLVPTPGQTEQEYLAKYLTDKGLFNYCRQKDFNLKNVNIPNIQINSQFTTRSS